MISRARSRGFAAIVAIVVAGTVASIGTYLAWQGTLAVRQVENMAAAQQADLLVRAATAWAKATLAQDDPRVDHRGEAWARSLPAVEIEGARIETTLLDEQAKFNVNNLVNSAEDNENNLAAFRRLLAHVGLPESLADAVVDWLDPDQEVGAPAGAEDSYYLSLDPPYRAANRPIADISELILVKGFSDDRLRRLAPYLTALPVSTRLNMNTADAKVLSAILPGLSGEQAKMLAAARDKEPFRTREDFAKRLPETAAQAAGVLCDVRSHYFIARGTVRVGRTTTGYRALLGRDSPAVISLTKGLG